MILLLSVMDKVCSLFNSLVSFRQVYGYPNALEVRNIEIEWLFAVEELAMSLNGIDIPNNSLGKVFVNRREPRLETTTSVSEVSTHD